MLSVAEAAAGGTPPILYGVDAIAEFLFPSVPVRRRRRRVHRLISEVPEADRLPTFKLGGAVCARPGTLLPWIAARERSDGRIVQEASGRRGRQSAELVEG
jgi:hypothetical protein